MWRSPENVSIAVDLVGADQEPAAEADLGHTLELIPS